MPRLTKPPPRAPVLNLRPAASEADLRLPASFTTRPQTITRSNSKGSFRIHRPSHYFRSRDSSSDAMDLSRPKIPVTISFSSPGIQPPVYVASSLTSPPWEPVEMDVTDDRTQSGDLVFAKKFDAVVHGEYQYKFRLGPGDWWICDESAPTVTDDAGNSNNILVVKPQSPVHEKNLEASLHRASSAPDLADQVSMANNSQGNSESSTSAESPTAGPIPFTVVTKAPDPQQPDYGGKEAESLNEDPADRAADAQPEAEYETTGAAASSMPIPTLIVEKIDDEPNHGDDIGPDATRGQQLAHQLRAADAEPDKVIIAGDAEEDGPLLPHETFEPVPEEAPLLPHERSEAVSEDSDSDDEDVGSGAFEPVDFDGDTPLFRHESISLRAADDSPSRSPSGRSSRSHVSLKDMMEEEDFNDPSLEPFPTRRETIFEHIKALEKRMEEDKSFPGDSSPSPTDSVPPAPASPLDSIKEDEGEEEDTVSLGAPSVPTSFAEPAAERPLPACPIGTVPTPPLTPKDEGDNKRLERADSVVTVTAEGHPKDSSETQDGAEDMAGPSAKNMPESSASEAAPAATEDVGRNVIPSSPKVSPERKHAGFMVSLWNTLFGSWMGPIGRWFSHLCGGRGRATALALATAAIIVAYAYQDVLGQIALGA